ncbi:hypothetical protein J2W98_003739 [Paenibacillus peoriae]|uniref:DNA-binding protein n=1 Tax=Paenibacillus peoriae TaxID=59893 RepID=A0ABU1QII8_9BACL|nr:hypothetical protein [Paenibacillus peoriae]MDR6779459.1 hypothetical protein [Paenibacillus peoriae]
MSKEKNIGADLHEMLLKSKEQRDKNSNQEHVLEKVKRLSLLPDDINATIEMVANYFEVDKEAIHSCIKDNRKELRSDGLKILRGKELREFVMSFKDMANYVNSKTRSLTIVPRRAMLRMGQLLRDSVIAIEIRNYLLDVEQESHDVSLFLTELDRNEERDSTRQGNSEIKLILKNKVGASSPKHYSAFFLKGYEGSYNVSSIKEYNALKGLHENAKPLDHMDSLELATYRFRVEMTKERIESGDISELPVANEIHKNIGKNVADLVESVTGKTLASLPIINPTKKLKNSNDDHDEVR